MYQNLKLPLFIAMTLFAGTNPAYSQGPMPACVGQAINAAKHIATADQGGDFDNINNLVLQEAEHGIVWKIVLREVLTKETVSFRVRMALPGCKIIQVQRLVPDLGGERERISSLSEQSYAPIVQDPDYSYYGACDFSSGNTKCPHGGRPFWEEPVPGYRECGCFTFHGNHK